MIKKIEKGPREKTVEDYSEAMHLYYLQEVIPKFSFSIRKFLPNSWHSLWRS